MTASPFTRTLTVGSTSYRYASLQAATEAGWGSFARLPITHKILLENLLRHYDDKTVTRADIAAFDPAQRVGDLELAYRPARVLMQDFTGVPAVVDLAAMRHALAQVSVDPSRVNPLTPVDLVIDHSIQVDAFGSKGALAENERLDLSRNSERYRFLRWGQQAFKHFRLIPPGVGICHQVNLEYLAEVVWQASLSDGDWLYPDTVVGTDSHTTMINGLGVLGWGVGGIEAEAAMLGQPISMLLPKVVGFKLTGVLPAGSTATDLVLMVTERLRQHGVVGKLVEFYGSGLDHLNLPNRATLANMAPEYGATCGFFPVDDETLRYLRLTGRSESLVARVEAYAKAQGLWRTEQSLDFDEHLELDLSSVHPCLAGPKRPQDRVLLSDMARETQKLLSSTDAGQAVSVSLEGQPHLLKPASVVIAAITSCTNTSNPEVMLAAGLLAQKAVARGLKRKPWVKTSMAPGSQVVTDYLERAGLWPALNALGFHLVGYGCTTCIGNSGPLPEPVASAIQSSGLLVSAVLSGNRNFEGRVHPQVKANWLASPPLVVAFALAGTTDIDLTSEALGEDAQGRPVYLKDLWPSDEDIQAMVQQIDAPMFQKRYASATQGDEAWRSLTVPSGTTYAWDESSTYVRHPPYFEEHRAVGAIEGARILAIFGDSITTDHISPAGNIKADSPAGRYLQERGVAPKDFNSYGARRGNHEIMMRGTFANIRIKNEVLGGQEGGLARHVPTGDVLPIYDVAMRYQSESVPVVVIAGKEYGTGSSRDWAAKGPLLLGVRAVIAESFERIHRSNLVGMGVLPFEFLDGASRHSLELDGTERVDLKVPERITPKMKVSMHVHRADGRVQECALRLRVDTEDEVAYIRSGGILQYVLAQLSS